MQKIKKMYRLIIDEIPFDKDWMYFPKGFETNIHDTLDFYHSELESHLFYGNLLEVFDMGGYSTKLERAIWDTAYIHYVKRCAVRWMLEKYKDSPSLYSKSVLDILFNTVGYANMLTATSLWNGKPRNRHTNEIEVDEIIRLDIDKIGKYFADLHSDKELPLRFIPLSNKVHYRYKYHISQVFKTNRIILPHNMITLKVNGKFIEDIPEEGYEVYAGYNVKMVKSCSPEKKDRFDYLNSLSNNVRGKHNISSREFDRMIINDRKINGEDQFRKSRDKIKEANTLHKLNIELNKNL